MERKTILSAALAVGAAAILMNPDISFAINFTLDSNAFAYPLYDIAVNKILQGPVGYVGGMTAMVIGAISLITGRILAAVPAILGGAALLKAPDLIHGLGLLF
jgi:hypothetical protein